MRLFAALAVMLCAPTALSAATPTPRDPVEAMFAAVNAHDPAALAALYADDAVIVSSETCRPMTGPAAMRQGHEDLVKAMPDLRDEPTHWVMQGNQVAVLFTAHSQALGPTGEMTLADFLTVKNGKIVRDVTIFNPGGPCR